MILACHLGFLFFLDYVGALDLLWVLGSLLLIVDSLVK